MAMDTAAAAGVNVKAEASSVCASRMPTEGYSPEQRAKAAADAIARGVAPVKLEHLQPKMSRSVEKVVVSAVAAGGEASNKSRRQQRKVSHHARFNTRLYM